MTEAELVGAYIESLQAIDGNFQFWLSITFALLVATYLANRSIPKALQFIASTIYLAASVLFAVRLFTLGVTLTSLRDQIVSLGSQTHVVSTLTNALIGILYLGIMVGGTLATIAFVAIRGRGNRDETRVA